MRIVEKRGILAILVACAFFMGLFTGKYMFKNTLQINLNTFKKITSQSVTTGSMYKSTDNTRNLNVIAPAEFEEDEQNSGILLPSDDAMKTMTKDQLINLLYNYLNGLQVLCRRVLRLGHIDDGGKEVCDDAKYRPRSSCLVYSFGIGYRFDFDDDAIQYYGCEMHCFDPSMTNFKHRHPGDKAIFHPIGLAAFDGILNASTKTEKRLWEVRKLNTIRSMLNHTKRDIDILKMDVEGSEYASFLEMARSGELKHVRQICVELHSWAKETINEQITVMRTLYEHGFRIFMRERNLYHECLFSSGEIPARKTQCMEMSLVNIHWKS
ncbi:hypothetical protein CHS0354_042107 [Potamilus streckersoni]|uniref:Methyltransferase domain-containing protein n=1 Tax=Potamilus streckersoni TaxID=2493646 RepID=A0AAE0WGF5_9BIVA|nr:hypothetical protein CHS0354_042107 [Potamilus streckersoni]